MSAIAAISYAALGALLVAFQLALGLGAPWGHLAMGGRWPGRFPIGLRLAAVAQAALIVGFCWVVLARAGLVAAQGLPDWLIWVVLGFAVLGLVANLATPSPAERRLWVPVALAMLISVALVIFA